VQPAGFVLGADMIDGEQGLVFAAACALHEAGLRQFVGGLSPLGCWSMPYDAQVLRIVLAEAEAEGPTWELQRAAVG
jgi:hypothetical protein